MKNFIKHYLGKGRGVAELQIIKLTCKLEDLQKFSYVYDGVKYVSFEVAKMKTADNFGRDFTVYVSTLEELKHTTKVVTEVPTSPVDPILEEETVTLEEECPFF